MVATAPGPGSPDTGTPRTGDPRTSDVPPAAGDVPGGDGAVPTPPVAGSRTAEPDDGPGRRRGRVLWVVVPVVVLALLAGGGYGAAYGVDVGVRGMVADKVEAAVSGALADGGQVTTTLAGRWGGLEMLAGRTVGLDVDVQDLDWGGTPVDLTLDLTAAQYAPTGGTATMTLPVEALAGRFGGTAATLDMAAVDGALQFTGDVDLLLENVVLDMDLVFEDGTLTLVPAAVSADGHDLTVTAAAKNPITKSLTKTVDVDLSDVPDGVTITSITLEGDQLVLDLDLSASAFAGITG